LLSVRVIVKRREVLGDLKASSWFCCREITPEQTGCKPYFEKATCISTKARRQTTVYQKL
jgi:hypothetical protein